MSFGLLAALLLCSAETPCRAQSPKPTAVLRVTSQEVLVHAVVRGSNGRPVANLEKDDFRVYDNGKLQTLSSFTVERSAGSSSGPTGGLNVTAGKQHSSAVPASRKRYVALFFDDLHLPFADLVNSRKAAGKFIVKAIAQGAQAGVYTASGKPQSAFTNDSGALLEALKKLSPQSLASLGGGCPHLDPYEAYLVADAEDPTATSVAVAETKACLCHINLLENPTSAEMSPSLSSPTGAPSTGGGEACPHAAQFALGEARQVLAEAALNSRLTLDGLQQLVLSMSSLHGQRTIVLVSPGFFSASLRYVLDHIINLALKSGITIGALDSKGVYTVSLSAKESGSGGQAMLPANLSAEADSLVDDGVRESDNALASLASATGGVFYHNDNDLEKGLREVGSPSAVVYLLTYTPTHLRNNGQFHKIKIKIMGHRGDSVEARQGYFAPSKILEARAQAADAIEQALFSHNDLRRIQIKAAVGSGAADKITVFTHVELASLPFKKEHGRNVDTLKCVAALFTRSGKFVAGREKTARMRLSDAELKKLRHSGVVMTSRFVVKPGVYDVRIVVREANGGEIAARTGYVRVLPPTNPKS